MAMSGGAEHGDVGRCPPAEPPADALGVEGGLPPLDGAVDWLNSPPLTRRACAARSC